MKTAFLLTQPLGRNYGGVLQNYALQHVLSKLNYNAVTICFSNRIIRRRIFELFFLNSFSINVICRIVSLLPDRVLEKIICLKLLLFLKKRTRYIILRKDERAIRKIIRLAREPIIIVGSDQVWRPKFSPFLPFFFCSFLDNETKCKHITYAASFGVDFWEFTDKETKMASELITGFEAVSVREKSAVKLCKDYLGYNKAVWVPDPTLLLTREEYLHLIHKKAAPEPYIATYFLKQTEKKDRMIKIILDLFQLKRIDISPRFQKGLWKSPEEWLDAIHSASYIITDSFHGTVFSLIFHKQFVVLHNEFCGETRLKEILDLFDLNKRLFDDDDIFNISAALNSTIDYSIIDDILISCQKTGYGYLSKFINQ